MKWFYAEGKKPVGPYDENEFMELVDSGAIKRDALVWRSGMKAWKPLSELDFEKIRESSGRDEKEHEDLSAETGDFRGPAAAPEEFEAVYEPVDDSRQCAECGGLYSADDMIRYGDQWICQNCKPLFAQKIREGATPVGELDYGGFWVRAGAKIIDIVILWTVGIAISVVLGLIIPLGPESSATGVFAVLLNLFQLAIAVAYTTYFLGKYSATPGKMACRLKVVTPDGGPITYGRACGRYFAEILSSLIFCLGYFMAAFDMEKRTLHDRIVGTRVVKNS